MQRISVTWLSLNRTQARYVRWTSKKQLSERLKIIAPSTRTTQLTKTCDQLCAWFGKEQNIHAESELRRKFRHCLPRSLSLHTHTASSRDPHLVFDQHTHTRFPTRFRIFIQSACTSRQPLSSTATRAHSFFYSTQTIALFDTHLAVTFPVTHLTHFIQSICTSFAS